MSETSASTRKTRKPSVYRSQTKRNRSLLSAQQDQDSPSEAESTGGSPASATRSKSKARSTIGTPSKPPSRLSTPGRQDATKLSSDNARAMKPPSSVFMRPSTPSWRATSVASSTTSARSPRVLPSAVVSPSPSVVSIPGKRKSSADRQRELETHALSGTVESTRVYCTRCESWVSLSKKTPYSTRPWYAHLRQCGSPAKSATSGRGKGDETDHEDEDDAASTAPPPSVVTTTAALSEPENRRNMTDVQRRGFLKADPRAEEVRPHEVLCRACRTWVKLDSRQKYSVTNWMAHQSKCSSGQPSDRVASAERKLKLVNDSLVKLFTEHEVVCRACDEKVQLIGSGDYNLDKWNEHKDACRSRTPTQTDDAVAPGADSALVATQPTEDVIMSAPDPSPPPGEAPPVASADATPIPIPTPADDEGTPSRKRPREEDDDEDGVTKNGSVGTTDVADSRPMTRARTETYEAPTGRASGLWDRLLVPWRIFVQGFAEGFRGSQ